KAVGKPPVACSYWDCFSWNILKAVFEIAEANGKHAILRESFLKVNIEPEE
ncbi:hypothetical protein KIN20_033102, partial [Parelaphostrongylus tenuis]